MVDRNKTKIALVLGNGDYANELRTALENKYDIVTVALTPREFCTVRGPVDLYATPLEIEKIILNLQKAGVTELVFAGDIRFYRNNLLYKDFLRNAPKIFVPFFLFLWRYRFNWGVVGVLQYYADRLAAVGIVPRIASYFVPDLCPRSGEINVGTVELSEAERNFLAQETMQHIRTHPRRYVRQAVAYDGSEVVAAERENTDALLRSLRSRPNHSGKPRTLVKLSAPAVSPTIDAPVIGPDTIENAHQAGINVIIVDSDYGIIADRKTVCDRADHYGITIYGMPTSVSNY